MFKARELSPVELMEAVIAQAETVEPVVNALCHQFFDEALDQARDAEQRYAGKGDPPRPLEGIPLAIKEEEAVAVAAAAAASSARWASISLCFFANDWMRSCRLPRTHPPPSRW